MIYDKLMILSLDHRHYIKESPLRNTETAFFFRGVVVCGMYANEIPGQHSV